MLFNTITFPLFLIIVLVAYHCSPRRYQNIILLTASYLFYSFWDWRFLSLLAVSTLVDYYCGKRMGSSGLSVRRKNGYLILSLVANLGILGFFKYYNFFVDSFTNLCNVVGFFPSPATLNIILPVGISFYTFQTLSYTIDVHRGKLKPVDNFLQFALYVSFFPQLVAGPIERARRLLPQLQSYRRPDRTMIWEGLLLVVSGYIKKVVISDQICGFPDHAFANWATVPSIVLWEGLCLFALQIYFDFSGYSDIARGVSRWFGIDLMVNFKQPYFSKNITEFWHRWHISLSTWLKEYLYIPLGGNRKGTVRTYVNLMMTMLLGGLWHGASLTFVFWGMLHGIYLSVHKFYLTKINPKPRRGWRFISFPELILKILFTHFLVLITWVPFRAPNFEVAIGYLQRMFLFQGPFDPSVVVFVLLLYVALWIIDYPIYRSESEFVLMRLPRTVRISFATISLVVISLLLLQVKEARPFIYFQF